MKLVSLSFMALAASQTAFALVGNYWGFSGNPFGGLRDVTFPFKMDGAAHKSGYYFAQQFNFQGIREVGYCGIQNRPNSTSGKSIVHAVFSTFQGNSTTQDRNCHMGADGGPGVSCAVDFPGSYNAVYNIVVEKVKGTTWKGTAINKSTPSPFTLGPGHYPPPRVASSRTKLASWSTIPGTRGATNAVICPGQLSRCSTPIPKHLVRALDASARPMSMARIVLEKLLSPLKRSPMVIAFTAASNKLGHHFFART
ncbi:hypothetical protein E4U40_003013 [Claviceps sp. LM458 group G5]|nr:hypothetical protein E4U40_003013 [Claviceps sp. LM458 group G5]